MPRQEPAEAVEPADERRATNDIERANDIRRAVGDAWSFVRSMDAEPGATGPRGDGAAVEPAAMAEPEPEPTVAEPELLNGSAEVPLCPMAEFGTAEVLRWLDTVVGLSGAQRAAVKGRLEEEEYIGQDLLDVTERTLPRLLRGMTGAVKPSARLSFRHSAAPSSTCSGRFNSDGERVSAK